MTSWTALALLAFAVALYHALRVEAWRRAFEALRGRSLAMGTGAEDVEVTLVVPARDASSTLAALLQDLHAQAYPRERVQVVVVDDHSTDDTAAIVERMALRWPQLQLVRLSGTAGKKAAISAGVKAATGTLVLLTDADARCGPGRVEAVVRHWQAEHWDLLLLPVRTIGEGFLGMLQEEEQGALLGSAVGLVYEGRPLLANGANMAFTKAAFEQVGGYAGDRWASGDDVFLVERMRRARKAVAYLLDVEVLVTVEAERNWRGFLRQRLRWAGKMRGIRDTTGTLLGGLGLLLPWLLLVVTVVLADRVRIGQGVLFTWALLGAAWCAWLMPVLGLAGDTQRFLSGASSRRRSLVALLAFTLYAPVIALLSMVWRPKWKGRKV
jgi:cellulose synthase/poly-beta-1,6-N-acetylglucosamine synthase-like glycosyltransferase